MTAIDWICLGVLLASLLLGAWRGLVYELMALAGWVIAFLVARWAAQPVGLWLPMGESPEPLRHAAGFVLVFIGTAFLCGMLAALLRRAVRGLGARPVDRVFGAAFGTLRGLLILLLAAALVLMSPLHTEAWWRESIGARWLETGLAWLHPLLPEAVGKYLSA